MGKFIPRANDGSNYYQARRFNTPPEVEIEAEINEDSSGISTYATLSGLTFHQPLTFVAAPRISGKSLIDSLSQTTWTSTGIFTSGTFTFDAQLGEPSSWIGPDGNPLSEEQQRILQEDYARVPEHEFEPNSWGQCDLCPAHNMYRNKKDAHLFVIQETLSLQDWREQLAS